MNNLVAIIPARGGSKRIPRKNIKPFHGKPIISYAIENCLRSGICAEVMVSTDDDEISQLSQALGAKVPFKRSAETSNDFAGTLEVLKEVVQKYSQNGKTFSHFLCLYPATPLLTATMLKDAWEQLLKNKNDFLITINRYHHPTQRALRCESGKVSMIDPTQYSKRTQDLPATYHDAGQFYFGKVASLLKATTLLDGDVGAYEIPLTHSQDIDNETDWKLAEAKFKLLSQN